MGGGGQGGTPAGLERLVLSGAHLPLSGRATLGKVFDLSGCNMGMVRLVPHRGRSVS